VDASPTQTLSKQVLLANDNFWQGRLLCSVMVWTPVCTATYGKNYGVGRQHVEQPSTADSISFHERVVATSDHWQAHHFDDGVID
jgi:hypothetical protein